MGNKKVEWEVKGNGKYEGGNKETDGGIRTAATEGVS